MESITNCCKRVKSKQNFIIGTKIKIIHLSLGSVQPKDDFLLFDSRVAGEWKRYYNSCSLQGRENYSNPASFECVIGVERNGKLQEGMYALGRRDLRGMELQADGRQLLFMNGQKFFSPSKNSYAAPAITSHIYKICAKNFELGA